MQTITTVLGITAALLHALAYVLYNLQAKSGQSKPNAASWAVWAFTSVLNALSYREMSGGTAMALQFVVGSTASVLTFLYVLCTGKFTWLKPKEWILLAIALCGVLVWWKFKTAEGANMIILTALLISFKPTIEGLLADPFKEKPRSWIIWTIACTVSTVNAALNFAFAEGKASSIITPAVLIFVHGAVAFLSRKSRKLRFGHPAR